MVSTITTTTRRTTFGIDTQVDPYKGVQISLVHVGGTHGGEVGGQYLGNFHGEKNAMGSVRLGNIAGPGGASAGYNHTHVKVFLNGKLTDPRRVFCK